LWEQRIIPETEAIRFGGVTNHWLRESLLAGYRALRDAGKIGVPLLLLQAQEDSLSRAGAQNRFCARAPRCRKVLIQGARHEILIERDDLRSQAVDQIRDFLSAQLRSS
jgi:lysophospholipase